MAKNTRRKKLPAYNAEDAAVLKSAKIDHKVKQPPGTVKAVAETNPHQRDRITSISLQERVVKDSDGRIDTCRAAIVTSLPLALSKISHTAREGLEGFHGIYWDAQPSQAMSYEPRVPSNSEGDGVNHAYDRLMAVKAKLVEVGGRTGHRLFDRACEIVTAERHAAYDGLALGVAERTGSIMAAALADMDL